MSRSHMLMQWTSPKLKKKGQMMIGEHGHNMTMREGL